MPFHRWAKLCDLGGIAGSLCSSRVLAYFCFASRCTTDALVSSRSASLPIQRGARSERFREALARPSRRRRSAPRLRAPIARSAQLTPFLTKLRSSLAARSIERQAAQERRVAGALVVQREAREQREGRALHELVAPFGPLLRPCATRAACGRTGGNTAVSQIAQLSKSRHQRSICADVTRAGSSTNAASMRASYQPRLPQRGGELVAFARGAWPAAAVRHRDAERLVRRDRVARHAVAAVLGAAAFEPCKDIVGLVLQWPRRRGWRPRRRFRRGLRGRLARGSGSHGNSTRPTPA